jgi:UDP-N-acetylmuramoyl-L-alanyl-D-glutamate--2,6-diaminopimelate ligase
MKKLSQLLSNIEVKEIKGDTACDISKITLDSRDIGENTLFVATKITDVDRHAFIDDAVSHGAIAVLCEKMPEHVQDGIVYVLVADSQEAAGEMSAELYDHPSEKLKLVGITGTNGKTTTATLLYQLFNKLGHKSGLISTVGNKILDQAVAASHTTPYAPELNKLLADMVAAGCTHAFMEVSSHSIVQKRIAGLHFVGGVFTNLTHDHLDYHKTIDEYAKAKKLFFDSLHAEAFALSNLDDPWGEKMLADTKAEKKYYSMQKDETDFTATIVKNDFSGTTLDFGEFQGTTKLIGTFNAYNILAVYGAARLLDEDEKSIIEHIPLLIPVEGRFQYSTSAEGVTGIVDYAHTPDAFEKILKTVKNLKRSDAKMITVFGCGGDRDPLKRPVMGHIAGELSDVVIVTSDNPRSEDPQMIIEEIKKGIDTFDLETKKYLTILDRREAIKKAAELAQSDDVIVLLGKGHEKYQEIKGVKHPFDDMQVLQENLKLFEK